MMIGEVIKKRRALMKLTQEELADMLNVTPQAVSRWENEKPNRRKKHLTLTL